jgi:ATP-dependent Clp protease ATP-binding subunit ClpA
MFEKYTEGARSAIFVARLKAVRRGFRTIEPAHLLLGVLQQGEIDPLFADDLPKLETIRGILVNGLTAGREPLPDKTDIPLAHTSKRILAYAAEESELMQHAVITSAHFLLGILRESRTRQRGILYLFPRSTLREAAILAEHGVDYDTLRTSLSRSLRG